MKVLIDSDILINAVTRPADHPQDAQVIDLLLDDNDYSLWVSALSLANLREAGDLAGLAEVSRNCLDRVLAEAAVIPFRLGTFRHAADSRNGSFMPAAILSAAKEMNIHAVVAGRPDQYPSADIPVLDAATFLARHASGKLQTDEQVPFLDLKAQHHLIYNEIEERLGDIIANTGFILGKHVDEFEKDFANIQESRYALGVSSGTDALHVALAALGIGAGDAVAVPVNTFIATAEAVSLAGAVPVFVDCDAYFNMDVGELEKILVEGVWRRAEGEKRRGEEDEKIRSAEEKSGRSGERLRVKAVIPVHLYGQPANMDAIMGLAARYDVAVVEDACQAHLARYKGTRSGNFGSFGAFSFYPGKNLGAYGEAGALTTNNEALYQKAKMVRQHGEVQRYRHGMVGHNYRMEAIQGAVLATKLKHIEEWTARRRKNAALYTQCLAGIEGVQTPMEPPETECVYHLYVIQTDRRDELQKYLGEHGIATGLHYPVPLHLQPAYAHLNHQPGDFPVAEKAAARILSLPMYPELREGQIRYVCDKIREFFQKA
jgi:dTDP-4-amino-4,6-dideoxygalactose transaminase